MAFTPPSAPLADLALATDVSPSSGSKDTPATGRRRATHPQTESGPCSSSFSPSCPSALPIRTGGWRRRRRRAPGSGWDPPALCWSGWRSSGCEKAPCLCASEKCCSFWGTPRVPSPTSLTWLWKAQAARGAPRGWEGRRGSSAAWCVDAEPARVREKGCVRGPGVHLPWIHSPRCKQVQDPQRPSPTPLSLRGWECHL